MQTITRLIKKIASHPSTEEFIQFVAGDEEMLKACQGVLQRVNDGSGSVDAELREQCSRYNVPIALLTLEVQRIINIFEPGAVNSDSYAVLGLAAGAGLDEVKPAFRRLSLQYHPDASGDGGSSEKFIEICKAYKTILAQGEHSDNRKSEQTTSWRYKKEREISPKQERNNVVLVGSLAAILILVSIIVPFIYKKKVMLQHLQNSTPEKSQQLVAPAMATPPDETSSLELTSVSSAPEIPPVAVNNKEVLQADDKEETGPPVESSTPKPVVIADNESVEPKDEKPELQKKAKARPPETKRKPEIEEVADKQPPVKAYNKNADKVPATVPVEIFSSAGNKNSTAVSSHKQNLEPEETATSTSLTKRQIPLNDESAAAATIEERMNRDAELLQSQLIETRRIQTFIKAYSAAYESRNLQKFTAFFDPDALENGVAFADHQEKYTQLFQSADKIALTISILSWERIDNLIQLTGRFRANIFYPQTDAVQMKGQIFFLLREGEKLFKVKELKYKFDQ